MPSPTANPSSPHARFTDRAAVYSRARPTYPGDAMDAIVSGCDTHGATTAADIGAGTGISSRLLAARRCNVLAIEPNRDMRERGAADTRDVQPPIRWIDACGESTTLDDTSVDLILCAQSFHWLDRPRAMDEFHRILRPLGRLAMLWNIQNRDDVFTAGYCSIMSRHAVELPRSPWALPGVAADLVEDVRFAAYRVLVFPHEQTLDRDGLVERALSASYSPKSGQPFLEMAADLREHFDRFERDGHVTLRYKTEIHIAERTP